MVQKQPETRKQDGSCLRTSKLKIRVLKKKKSSLLVETPEERGKKRVNKKNVINKLCESNINTVVEEHFSSENTQTFWNCCQSTMIKTVEQSTIVKKAVLPEASKLNDSVMNKSHRDQTQFSPEKRALEKGKWISYYLYIRYLLSLQKPTYQPTNKQTIQSFNYIQAPGLHITQYYNIYKSVIIYS